ncbi:MAG TPA: hypothetical protein VMM18_15785 [Gemmatimonadaceae bacterium]|nr:hypothetical protein [Gemmatimonadaceae bacterium]
MSDRGKGGSRKDLGDDQGTRVGSPTPADERDREQPPEHLRDSFEVRGQGAKDEPRRTGAGSEAAEGVHSSDERDPTDNTALDSVDTGHNRYDEATIERAGSEPLQQEREHTSGYGGEGGYPKTSSDRREPLEPEGRFPNGDSGSDVRE